MMKIKNTTVIICFLVLGAVQIKAQEAPTATGGDASGAGGTVAYSVGQVFYADVNSSSGNINPGVQQPYEIIITGGKTIANIDLSISVYPNPTAAFINLKIENMDLQNLSFQLFDIQGKLLLNQKITNVKTTVKMDDLAMGNYFLKVMNNNSELKSFKINKN